MSTRVESEPSFSVGIEEEYLLVDRESRDLVNERPVEMMAAPSRVRPITERIMLRRNS